MMIDTVKNWFGRGGQDVQTSAHAERTEPSFVQTSVQNATDTTVIRSSDPQVIDLLGGAKAASGFAVTEASAMRVSTVYACVRLIASTIADMPLNVYERMEGFAQVIESEIWYLLNEQPHAVWTAAAMWEWVLKSMLLRGDGFCEILRDRRGAVIGLLPLHPDGVRVDLVDGRLRYSVCTVDGKIYGRDQDDMLHFPGFGFDGRNGMSVIQYAAFQSIGIALAADNFSGKFFANGATPKHLIKAAHKMDEEQIDLLRRTYDEKYSGVDNAGKPMVLTQGLDIKELSLSSADVELLASRKYQVIDICRAFGVPPVMVGAQETTSSWGSGIEQLVLGFVKFTCLPHMTRMRQELNRKLYRTSGKIFVAHDYDALLAGDTKSEADYLRQAVGGSQGPGWMKLNEARRKKNLPPVPGGDQLYYPKNGKANDEQTPPAAAAR